LKLRDPRIYKIRFTNEVTIGRRLHDYLPGLKSSNKVKNDRIKGDRQGV